jgi:Leucine-rich repeat (LRR) protein
MFFNSYYVVFYIYLTFIIELPNLYYGLTYLNCSDNNLYEVPYLPPTLKKLLCSYNYLTELSELSSILDEIDCSNNQIDKFPSNLKKINVSYNQLKKNT